MLICKSCDVEYKQGAPMLSCIYCYRRITDAETIKPKVVSSLEICFGRNRLEGTGIPVDVLFERFVAGECIADIGWDCDLTNTQVEEAIRFEIKRRKLAKKKKNADRVFLGNGYQPSPSTDIPKAPPKCP